VRRLTLGGAPGDAGVLGPAAHDTTKAAPISGHMRQVIEFDWIPTQTSLLGPFHLSSTTPRLRMRRNLEQSSFGSYSVANGQQ
jgi:hypothetical protein